MTSILSRASAALLLLFPLLSIAQEAILLKNATIALEENAAQFVDELIPFAETFNGKAYRLVQFDEVLSTQDRLLLGSQGFELLEYIPHKAYVVSFAVSADRQVLLDKGARSVVPMGPAFKVNRAIQAPPYPEYAVSGKTINVLIQVQKDIQHNEVLDYLKDLGAEVLSIGPSVRLIDARIPIKKIALFGSLPFVSQLEAIGEPGEPEALDAQGLHRSLKLNSSIAGGLSYDGSGVSIAINDDGFAGPHIDFEGRTDQSDVLGDLTGDHGDMTAGIAGGAGNIDPTIQGMAPGAFLWIRQYSGSLPDVISLYQNEGVLAFSSSYSNGCNAGYTGTTQQVDDEIYNNPEIIQSFSAGNSNNNDCGYGAGDQWANVTGGHKIAKNAIAAANLRYNEVLETSSSRGPASDGRIKPDIAAHGTAQLSTDPNNTYAPGGGTSAACPGITGVYAQLVHAYRDMNGGSTPESGLIKACMLNTAYDLGNTGPDYKFGWGRVNASSAYDILEKGQYLTDQISQGQSSPQSITIPSGVEQMRVMLYWMDPAASTASAKALVNDLDLEVTDPSGAAILPWILDPTPNPTTLDLPATNGVDTLNNMEQVLVNNPTAGTYTLNITGSEVPMGPQTYYIVWEMYSGVDMVYPNGGEGLPPQSPVRLLWDAVGNSGDFQLDYSLDGGSSWVAIATVPGNERAYENWITPNAISGDVRVRVTRGVDMDMSEADLSIIEQPNNLNILRVCPQDIRLSWDSVPGATSYTVHQLGSMYMDSVATSSTFFYDLPVVDIFQDFWWSVTAHGPSGMRSRRAIAQYYAGSGLLNCSANDELSVTDLLSPLGDHTACNGVDSIITIQISNNGLLDQSGFPVGYSVNNATPVIETYTSTLIAGTNATFSFSTPFALTGASVYNFKVWSDLAGDAVNGNDTAYGSINVQVTNNVPDYSEDFEAIATCPTVNNCEQTICPLGVQWFNATNGDGDDIDWRVDNNGTPSQGTGPDVDHTTGSPSGRYIYTEASNGCTNRTANLISACVDLNGIANPELVAWYHMDGVAMGELHVDVYDGSSWNLDVAPPIVGSQGNAWQEWVVDLAAYTNMVVNVRLRGITGSSWESDLALDDVGIFNSSSIGISEMELESLITLFPNPAKETVNVQFGERVNGVVAIEVFDATGALVLSSLSSNPEGVVQLDVRTLNTGLYSLRISAGQVDHTMRFVLSD